MMWCHHHCSTIVMAPSRLVDRLDRGSNAEETYRFKRTLVACRISKSNDGSSLRPESIIL